MSNQHAIATVTQALKTLLGNDIGSTDTGAEVKTLRPGSPDGNSSAVLNIYLYQVMPNVALRNADLPTRDSAGDVVRRSRAALDLYYLLTFYGNEAELQPDRLLGYAVRVLHNQPILTADFLNGMTLPTYLKSSGLAQQAERVKFTPVTLDLEELSKLWSAFFQVPYSLSVVYRASVVLIESESPERSPFPVLRRGSDDHGVVVQSSLAIPYPTLETVEPPNLQPRAVLEDILTITGHHLDGDSISLVFENARWGVRNETSTLVSSSAISISVQLPNEPADWPVGVYTVFAEIVKDGETLITNKVPFVLAPKITTEQPITAELLGNDATLTLQCSPDSKVDPHFKLAQRVSLILADREILAEDVIVDPEDPQPVNEFDFIIENAELGKYYIRLRIDGVDSLLVDRSTTPPEYDETQKVTITL